MKKNRYPGVKPFEADERDLFFGRDRDIRDLYDLIFLEKLVVVFGKSGYGKSSLLNAGVIPIFQDEQDDEAKYFPLVVRLGSYVEGKTLLPIDNLISRLEEIFPYTGGAEFLDNLTGDRSLWYEFKRRQSTVNCRFVLVFDQFEEFFSYPPEARQQLKEQLSELLYQAIPQVVREQSKALSRPERQLLATPLDIKAVFVIREDRLSSLDSLKDKLPAILHKRYELKALSREQAREAIVRPASLKGNQFASCPFVYSEESLEHILNELSKEKKIQQQKIEAFQLQILCQYLETEVKKRDEKGIIIHPSDLPDIANILEAYYNRQITRLPEEQRQAAHQIIEDGLILVDFVTGEGRRLSVDGELLVQQYQGLGATTGLLKALENTFLLRREANTHGGFNYEVSHDTLVIPILKTRAERKEKDEQLKQELEKEQIRKNWVRQQRIWWLIGVAVCIAAFLLYKGYDQKKTAEKIQQNTERKAELTAMLKRIPNQIFSSSGKDSTWAAQALSGIGNNLPSAFMDPRDKKIYETVELNDHIWMADNLDFLTEDGSWYYENDEKNGNKYGRLYTWQAALKACPLGWRLPKDIELYNLAISQGGLFLGYRIKNKESGKGAFRIWKEGQMGSEGTTGSPQNAYSALIENGSSGFSANFGGSRSSGGDWFGIKKESKDGISKESEDKNAFGAYWSSTSTEIDDEKAYYYHFSERTGKVYKNSDYKSMAFSCRCIKDE